LANRVASPKEIAVELGLTKARAGRVSDHVRELEKGGLVELVRTEQRRGAVEHYYRAIERPIVTAEEFEEWTVDQRDEFSRFIIHCMAKDFGLALEHGTLDADENYERHLTRTPLLLDRRGFNDLLGAFMQVFDRSFEIQAESDERRGSSGEIGMRVSSILGTIPLPLVVDSATIREP
jgi:DNA-binding MarR family transcriptional regulator